MDTECETGYQLYEESPTSSLYHRLHNDDPSSGRPDDAIDTDADDPSNKTAKKVYQYSGSTIKALAWAMRLFLFATVLTCLLYSKLTIIQIFEELHLLSNFSNPIDSLDNGYSPEQVAATLYWMLFFIVVVPNIITWFRSLLSGVFKKSTNQPWPKCSAIFTCLLISIFEAIAETLLTFHVFIALPPTMSLLLMCGICRLESICDLWSAFRQKVTVKVEEKYLCYDCIQCCKKIVKSIGFSFLFIFQIFGIILVTVFLSLKYKENEINKGSFVIVPSCLLLSITWFGRLQRKKFECCDPHENSSSTKPIKTRKELLETLRNWFCNLCIGIFTFCKDLCFTCAAEPEANNPRPRRCGSAKNKKTARWKASFIASSIRLLIYPLASYYIFRLLYQLQFGDEVDPWAHSTLANVFQWTGRHVHVFTVHVITSLFGYILSWIACYMTLHVSGLVLPTIISTPLTLLIYFLSTISYNASGNIFILYPFQKPDLDHLTDWLDFVVSELDKVAIGLAVLLLLAQILATLVLYNSKNVILASDSDMFVRPYYNSVLLEQSLIINRSVSHNKVPNGKRKKAKVFVCTTMFRETVIEMKQMLKSIKRIADHKKNDPKKSDPIDEYESHIFFDGGCREDKLTYFAIQLMSLIPSTLGVELENCIKQETPYGYRFRWNLNDNLPFYIHLKDNVKVRNKKRWSQVMYMNYIINHRSKENQNFNLDNTFILTTDADMKFKAESADVLLDLLARDPLVGAVCSRTHPLGNGPLYWYQVFDYAIGHWLQKSTEHILGSVLCCPGCFSMFRCSALKKCLSTYSSEVETAMEFLTKDMGEDRWLCTLLVKKGCKLEYCAISNNYTYCPKDFDEFFKQRRRWMPSTIANLWLLVAKGRKITSNNEYISWAFIVYQVIILMSTIISPATVILVIASGLQSSFGLNSTAVVVTLSIVTLCYAITCLFANQKTQIDIAKGLTFLFSLIMAVVVAGLIMDTVEDILTSIHTPNITKLEASEIIHQNKKLFVADTTLYVGLFLIIFAVTAFLHFFEGLAIFHSLWYLLGLPSGYLLLLIYSAANLNDRSWGTREAKNTSEKSFFAVDELNKIKNSIFRKAKEVTNHLKGCCYCFDKSKINLEEVAIAEKQPRVVNDRHEEIADGDVDQASLVENSWIQEWLKENNSEEFLEKFVKEGYTKMQFVASMTEKDLKDIGVNPIGYRYHLLNAIKKLPQCSITTGLPDSVENWIHNTLDLDYDYVNNFHTAGYYGKGDVENLVHISKKELTTVIGVTKKAHVNRFLKGIETLKIRDKDEERVAQAEIKLQQIQGSTFRLEEREKQFWIELTEGVLKPIPDGLTQANKLRDELKSLRNYTLIAIFHINLIWLILLSVFTFSELKNIGLSASFLGLLFLAVYSVIILVQFIGMLLHRVVTFCQFIARLDQNLSLEQTSREESKA